MASSVDSEKSVIDENFGPFAASELQVRLLI